MTEKQPGLNSLIKSHVHKTKTVSLKLYQSTLKSVQLTLQTVSLIDHIDRLSTRSKSSRNFGALGHSVSDFRARLNSAVDDQNEESLSELNEEVKTLVRMHNPTYFRSYASDSPSTSSSSLAEIRNFSKKITVVSQKVLQLVTPRAKDEGGSFHEDDEPRRYIGATVWILAIVGMLIAFGFLIADFWWAQKHQAQRTDLVAFTELMLPAITICSGYLNVPSFENFPTAKYPGHALYAIRSYSNSEANQSYMWPQSQKSFKTTFIGGSPDTKTCSTNSQIISMKRGFTPKSTIADPDCQSCFQIGKPPLNITLHDPTSLQTRQYLPVSITMASSKVSNYCFSKSSKYSNLITKILNTEIKKHLPALEQRGTLTLNGMDYDLAFSQFRTYFQNGGLPSYLKETASFLCSIYFFSGYFYPATPADIRFVFSRESATWIKVGNGPYHGVEGVKLAFDSLLEELNTTSEVNSRSTLFVYVDDAEGGDRLMRFRDRVYSLDPFESYSMTFSKKLDKGKTIFDTSVVKNTKMITNVASLYYKWELLLDYKSFDVEVVSQRPATSVWEFLSDVTEIAGLFTGVCAYSILAAPARKYLQRTSTQE